MATKQSNQDKEARKGMILVAAIVIGLMVVGGAMGLFWQRYADKGKPKGPETRYFSLGEQAIGIGHHSMLIHFTLEYTGKDTEDALKKAQPALKNQVINLMARIQTSDLDKLRTPLGKKKLADDMLDLVHEKLPAENADNVKGVLYEKFLIGD